MNQVADRRGTRGRWRVAAAAAVLACAVPTAAAEDPFALLSPPRAVEFAGVPAVVPLPGAGPAEAAPAAAAVPRFAAAKAPPSERLLDRISVLLERGGAPERVDVWMTDPAPHSATTASLGRDVWRATRKSLERHLLDATTLDEEIESWDDRVRPGSALGDDRALDSGRGSSPAFRVGFSHLLPRLEMRCAAGDGALRVTVHARGRVGVDYRIGRQVPARIHFGYDPRSDVLRLGWRASF